MMFLSYFVYLFLFFTISLFVFFYIFCFLILFFLFKQKTAYEIRISYWSSDVCSSDLRPEEGAFDGLAVLAVHAAHGEDHVLPPLDRCRRAEHHRQRQDLLGPCAYRLRHVAQRDARGLRFDLDGERARIGHLVYQLDRVAVLDAAVAAAAVKRVAVAQHVDDQRAARAHAPGPGGDQRHQQHRVDQDPRARDPGLAAVDGVLRGVADQPGRVAHLVHDVVAGVDAGAAGDALVLQAVADVDAGRADLHADGAVDAVAQLLGRECRQRLGLGVDVAEHDRAGRLQAVVGGAGMAGGAEHIVVGRAHV